MTSSDACLAVIAIALLFLTFIYSVIVLRNFGRGLKDARKYPVSFLS